MGFGRVIAAAAAAAAPAVREQLRRVYSGDDREEREHTLATASAALPRPRRISDSSLESDRYAEDMARRPLIAVDTHGPSRPSHMPVQSYGAISGESPSTLRASPERYRRDSWLDRVPEETTLEADEEAADQEQDEWDLAEYGYYSGEFTPRLGSCYDVDAPSPNKSYYQPRCPERMAGLVVPLASRMDSGGTARRSIRSGGLCQLLLISIVV